MADITKESVQEKINKGENLTKEETQFVMQSTDGPDQDAQNTSDEELGLEEDGKKKDNTSKDDNNKEAEDAKKKAEADEAAKKKSEEEAEAKKKKEAEEAEAAKAKKADEESFHAKVEKTLNLADKDINLEGYTEKEKGLFWELRKERKARQQAEADRDAERFERIKKEKLAAEKDKAKKVEPEEGDEDFITQGELKKRLKKTEEERDAENAAKVRAVIIKTADMTAHSIVESRRAKGEDIPDYNKVMELGPVIIETNEEYAEKIREAVAKGKNPALVCYDLIRNDPRFKSLYNPEAPAAKKEEPKEEKPKDDKKKEGEENLKKIDANKDKPKTSAAAGGGGGEGDYGEYTFDQLVKMTTSEFRKVPKKVREKFLKDAG